MTKRAAANVLIGALLLMLLCVLAGRPQIFTDTRAYYALGQEIALMFQSDHQAATSSALGTAPATAADQRSVDLAYTVAASRSPYWSILFYLGSLLGSAWLVVTLQAVVAASTVWICARAFGVGKAYLPIMAGLAFLSSLPVQVMFLMPDLFAGLAILAAGTLAACGDRITRKDKVALWLVMVGSALFHTSHVLTLAGLGGAAVFAAAILRRHRDLLRPGAATLAAAAIGAIGAIAFPVAVELVQHRPVYAPPFVAARLIADGPGRAVLREDCRTGTEWAWCPYRNLPLNDVNTILWDTDPQDASFQAADYDRRVRIIGEQSRFAVEVVRRYPVEVASSTVRNIVGLFFQYGSGEALGDPTERYRDPKFAVFARIVPGTEACVTGAASCEPRINLTLLNTLVGTALVAGWITIAAVMTTAHGRRRWGRATLALIAGLCLNAAVCGGISGNAERYQARVTWLIPFLAMAMMARQRMQRRGADT